MFLFIENRIWRIKNLLNRLDYVIDNGGKYYLEYVGLTPLLPYLIYATFGRYVTLNSQSVDDTKRRWFSWYVGKTWPLVTWRVEHIFLNALAFLFRLWEKACNTFLNISARTKKALLSFPSSIETRRSF